MACSEQSTNTTGIPSYKNTNLTDSLSPLFYSTISSLKQISCLSSKLQPFIIAKSLAMEQPFLEGIDNSIAPGPLEERALNDAPLLLFKCEKVMKLSSLMIE